MQFKAIALSSLISLVAAQAPPLTSILSATPDVSQLTTLVSQYPDLLATLSNATDITILAPNNAAFGALLATPAGAAAAANADLLRAILTYHVYPGVYRAADVTTKSAFIPSLLSNASYTNVTGGQVVEAKKTPAGAVAFVSGGRAVSHVVTADVAFAGGVIHIIDSVLTLPVSVSDTAQANGLTTLVGALTATNLADTVDSLPDVTVFAPNNEAFEKISTVTANLTTELIASVLTYHVLTGNVVYSTELQNGQTFVTVNGQSVAVSISGNEISINDGKVVLADVLVANGVVHVIDNVLIPTNLNATNGTSTATSTATVSATTATGTAAVQTSSAAAPFAAVNVAALLGAGFAFFAL